jgi:hypothetical protein
MWNYPFDPNEIETENVESNLWAASLWVLGGFTIIYFGLHFLAFIVSK